MKNNEDYLYYVTIVTEILVNREQEYIRKHNKNDVEDYKSEFEEFDFADAKRWIRDTTETFCTKTLEETEKRIKFKFHNARINVEPLVENGYFYWFDNNCLVNNERLLHRANVCVQYKSEVKITEEDMLRIAKNEDFEIVEGE